MPHSKPTPNDTTSGERTAHKPVRRASQGHFVWLALGFILVLGVAAGLVLDYQRTQTLETGRRLTESIAQVIQEQTHRTFQAVDQRLELAADQLADMQASGKSDQREVQAFLKKQIEHLPFVRAMWTLDAQGRIQYDSDQGNIGVDLSDRDYFQVYQRNPATGFYIGDPVRSRSLGTWLISAARPLTTRDGVFSGIVVVAIEPPYFAKLWSSVAAEAGAAVSLLRRDGVLLMRSPHDDTVMGRSFANGPVFAQNLPQSPVGAIQLPSPIDGSARYFAYRAFYGNPELVIVVGRTMAAILAPWTQMATVVLAGWFAASTGILALSLYLARVSAQRQRADDRDRQSSQMLALAAESTGIVVWRWDLRQDYWYASPTHYSTLGYPPGSRRIGLTQWRELLHPDDRLLHRGEFDGISVGESQAYDFEARLRHADGSYRWVHVIGHVTQRDAAGKPRQLSGVRIDVTERKNAEITMRRAKDYAESLIAGANAMIVGLDARGDVTLFNSVAQEITGYTMADLKRRNGFEVLAPRDRYPQVWAEFERLSAGGLPRHFENPVLTKSGEERLIAWQNSQIRDPDGNQVILSFGVDVTERRRNERALVQSEKRLRDLMDGLGSALFIGLTTVDGLLVEVNQAARALAGLDASEPVGMQIEAFPAISHLPPNQQALRAAVTRGAAGESSRFELVSVSPDGRNLQLDVTAVPLRNVDGQLVNIVFAGLDVTARRLAEIALRESANQYRLLVEGSPYGIAVHQDGLLVMVNPSAVALMGAVDANAMIGRSILDRIHPDYRAAAVKRIARMLAGEPGLYPTHDRYLRFDGSSYDVEVTAAPFIFKGRPAVQVIAIDITERLRTVQALSLSEERFRTAFASSAIGMTINNLEGRWIQVNPAMCEIVGYPESELLGMDFQSITHPDDHDADLANMAQLLDGTIHHFQIEKRYIHRQGHVIWVHLTVSLLRDKQGQPLHTVAQVEDISQRVRLESDLRASQARLKATFDALPDLLFEVSLDGTIVGFQSPRTDLLLLPPEQFVGKSVAETMPAAAASVIHRALREADQSGHSVGAQYALDLPGGERWFELSISRKEAGATDVPTLIALARDITERQLLERRDEQEREALEFLASDRSLSEILEKFVISYENLLPGARGSVLLLDPDAMHLRHSAAPHLPGDYCDAIDGHAIGPNTGSCGTAAYTGKTVMVADIDTDARWADYRELALRHGLRACWSVPIKASSGKVLGTFAFYYDVPRAATASELALMERGAQLAGPAIERHLAAEALQQSEARYRTLVEWSPIGIGVHQDGVMVYANPACVAIFGAQSASELLGKRILDLMPPEEHPDVRARINKILSGESTSMVLRKYYKLDGSVIQVEGKGAPIEINGAPAVQFTMRDVTAENEAQTALIASRQQLRVLSARVLAAQETERRRVAHELHDELGQALTAIKINLQAKNRRSPENIDDLKDENIRIVEQTLQQVRGLALALRPSMLDDLGLLSALRWLTEQTATRHGIDVQLRALAGPERLPPDLETAVFRIVQEALTNIVRHADASHVEVVLQDDDERLVVRVSDDGKGFDVAAMQQRATQGGSMGVLGMAERATLVGATLTIDSTPGKGSSVTLQRPAGGPAPSG